MVSEREKRMPHSILVNPRHVSEKIVAFTLRIQLYSCTAPLVDHRTRTEWTTSNCSGSCELEQMNGAILDHEATMSNSAMRFIEFGTHGTTAEKRELEETESNRSICESVTFRSVRKEH